jgi:hypothetical protein
MIVAMPFAASKSQRALLFLSSLLSFVKKIQSCCKESILHLKSSSKPNYFLTSTPSRHTPSPWPITCKGHTPLATADLFQALLRWRDFDINLTSINSPFFPLISVYIFQISPVFINKVLQSFNKTGNSLLTSEKKTTKFQTS